MRRKERQRRREKRERPPAQGEEFLRTVFERATVGLAQLSLKGRWLLVNPKLCDILGYREEELGGLTLDQITFPEDLTRHTSELREMATDSRATCSREFRCLRKDGSAVWVLLSITLIRDHAGEPSYFLIVVEDTDQRKRAEEEVQRSEETFRQIFRLAPIGITISSLEEGEFIEFNEAAERLSGYPRQEVIGRHARDFTIWKDQAQRAAVIREVLEQGEVREREMVMKDKQGRTFLGAYSAMVIEVAGKKHLLSLVSDIGERKRTEEALRESEERFRLVADHAPVLIWEAGPDTGCTFLNRAWLEFTGRTLEEELGDGWTRGVHPEDREHCLQTYREAVAERKAFTLEYRLRRWDGEYGWMVDAGVPRFAPGGELLGYIGTVFDLTDQQKIKEQLQQSNALLAHRVAERTAELTDTIRKLQAEMGERERIAGALQEETAQRLTAQTELREKELMLLHQGRLAAMGEMIGNIAHQWRQPLNLLAMLVQELAMTWKKGEFSSEYLEKSVAKMRETIQHMSQTVGDFSNFFKPSKEKVQFRVVDAVEKTLSLLEPNLKAQQIRTRVLTQDDAVISGYPNELSQVFLNIIVNARDALVSSRTPDPLISIAVASREGGVVVTITDNAGGMPEEILERIFEPYFSTKPPEQGTGVGLFMSRTIIEKNMGGRLYARNVEGGAQFVIEI
jgi:PAS domain S-box-containing protein